jgi:methyl-accepting chemotaxis protein
VSIADEDAKKRKVVVRHAVEAMDAIAKSAQQVSQIIDAIHEIALQTNPLAVNAGVIGGDSSVRVRGGKRRSRP